MISELFDRQRKTGVKIVAGNSQKPASNHQPNPHNSFDDNQQKIKTYKKKVARSFILAFTTLIAIIAICIAWFVANNRVSGTNSSVSAQSSIPFELASMGVRQEAEEKALSGSLSAGTSEQYEKYIDAETGTEVPLTAMFYIGTNSLAWHLNGQETLAPGASGDLVFYLIPKVDGLKTADVILDLAGYAKTDGSSNAEQIKDTQLQSLIKGHILIFKNLDDEKGYSNWIGKYNKSEYTFSNSFTVKAPEKNGFQKGVPYKVTLHWIWPRYFRNYIYNLRSTEEDLFAGTLEGNETYQAINNFVNARASVSMDNYNYLFAKDNNFKIDGSIGVNMSDAVLDSCSKYYNKADEYIGKTAEYVYVQIVVR